MTAYLQSTLKPQDFANFVLKLSFKNISSPGNQNSGLRFHSIPFRILECCFSLRFRFLHDHRIRYDDTPCHSGHAPLSVPPADAT